MSGRTELLAKVKSDVLPAIEASLKEYYDWNHGWDDPPESYLQVAIARAFAALAYHPAMEVWLNDVIKTTSREKRGARSRGAGKGRFDIALANRSDTGKYTFHTLIETKRAGEISDIDADVLRLAQAKGRGNIDACLVFVYTTAESTINVDAILGQYRSAQVHLVETTKTLRRQFVSDVEKETMYSAVACYEVRGEGKAK